MKDDYQRQLTECHQKIQEHSSKAKEYDGWVQVLSANSEDRCVLDVDDWLFFFGGQVPAAA